MTPTTMTVGDALSTLLKRSPTRRGPTLQANRGTKRSAAVLRRRAHDIDSLRKVVYRNRLVQK